MEGDVGPGEEHHENSRGLGCQFKKPNLVVKLSGRGIL